MDNEEIIYQLLYIALLEIREEAYTTKSPKIFHLADLFHNVPLRLEKANKPNDYNEIMTKIKTRASEKGISNWVDNHINDLA